MTEKRYKVAQTDFWENHHIILNTNSCLSAVLSIPALMPAAGRFCVGRLKFKRDLPESTVAVCFWAGTFQFGLVLQLSLLPARLASWRITINTALFGRRKFRLRRDNSTNERFDFDLEYGTIIDIKCTCWVYSKFPIHYCYFCIIIWLAVYQYQHTASQSGKAVIT